MKAISETFGTERAAVKALRAGIDLVMVSHHYMRQQGSIEAIRVAVQTHELSSQAVQLAAEHMLRLKANYLAWKEIATSATLPACIGCEAHLQLQDQAYELSTTLVRNEDALLPLHLDAGERIVVLSPRRNSISMVEDRYYADDALSDIIGQYHTNVKTLSIASGAVENACANLLQTTRQSDIFIIATVNAPLHERRPEVGRYLALSARRIIVMAVRNP